MATVSPCFETWFEESNGHDSNFFQIFIDWCITRNQ